MKKMLLLMVLASLTMATANANTLITDKGSVIGAFTKEDLRIAQKAFFVDHDEELSMALIGAKRIISIDRDAVIRIEEVDVFGGMVKVIVAQDANGNVGKEVWVNLKNVSR